MTNMESLETQLNEQERQTKVYEAAVASLKAEKTRNAARGHAVMSSFMSYGRASNGDGGFGKVTQLSKLFMIGFLFLAPSILVWQVLL